MSFLKLAYKCHEILLEIHLGDDVDDTFLDDHALRTGGIGLDGMLIEEYGTVLEDVQEVVDEMADVFCRYFQDD